MVLQLKRSRKEPMSEINVTPFVDVMLVLLIIFMVTAPLLTVGVQVDLPESAADSLPDDQEPLTLSINSKGEIYIQEHQVTYQKMIPKLLAIAKNRTDTRIYVRGDKNINYGRVLEVMGTLSGGGTEVISLGRQCLLGANSGSGISLGDRCTIEAGLYVTGGTIITILDDNKSDVRKAKALELSGQSDLLFRRNSVTGAVECLTNLSAIELNSELHS